MDPESVLASLKFKKIPENKILEKVPYVINAAHKLGISDNEGARIRWIMGQLYKNALGNIPLRRLKDFVEDATNRMELRK
jgi:hypothetical protein